MFLIWSVRESVVLAMVRCCLQSGLTGLARSWSRRLVCNLHQALPCPAPRTPRWADACKRCPLASVSLPGFAASVSRLIEQDVAWFWVLGNIWSQSVELLDCLCINFLRESEMDNWIKGVVDSSLGKRAKHLFQVEFWCCKTCPAVSAL